MKEIPALLEKNLQELQKSQPKLTARLRSYMDELPALKEPAFRETPAGRWVEGITEKPFFEKKASLEKRTKAAPSAVYLVFGVGCAPYLFQVLRSLPREALSVVVIEPSLDLLLLTLSQTSVFQALPAGCRLSFIVEKDNSLIDEAFAWNVVPIGIFPVSKAEAFSHEGQGEWESMAGLKDALKKQIIYRLTTLGNSPEDTLLGFRHAALNTPRILKSPRISDLKGNYGGKPFVCVSSGPSLEKNVHLLKDIQDKCVIVACDTVLYHLLEKGIIPHAVTSIERPIWTYLVWLPKVLEKYREECRDILLISQSVSYPLTAGRWPGPNIVVGKMDVPVDSWYTGVVLGQQVMFSGLSVSHMALSLALACEASSIALIGQDLSYSEEGVSHASDTVPDSVLKLEQKRREGIGVPGISGGLVETSTIWLTFMQIFERMLASFPKSPVYDCTEGGALINGTLVLPLAEYIQENIVNPKHEVDLWQDPQTAPRVVSDLKARFSAALSQLDMVEKRLEDMRKEMDKCIAPALLPEKRQAFAFNTAGILDSIHAMNPVISFIGQSYTHLSGTVLAENRFLETVEQVERWKELHEEIADSHSFAVNFLRQWLQYAQELVKVLEEKDETTPELTVKNNGEEEFTILFKTSGETGSLSAILSDILSTKDPVDEKWSPGGLWQASLFKYAQGGAAEARRYMQKAYDLMEGEELSTEVLGAFFKDWGKIMAADDLTTFPDSERALNLLHNAKDYLPDDPEVSELQQAILARQSNISLDKRRLSGAKQEELALFMLRSEAEAALVEGNLPKALKQVEELVWKGLDNYPDFSIQFLQWLMKTTANCTEAADKEIATLSTEILDRIIARLPAFVEKRIEFPLEFLSYLNKIGIKFSLEPSDKETEIQ